MLPQAFRMTIPPLINVFIALTKNTSVAGGFFVVELFATTRQLANDNGNIVIQILITAAVLYLVITVPLGFLAGQLETALGGEAMSGASVLFDAPGPKARRLSLILSIVALVLLIAGAAWVIVDPGRAA